MTSTLATLSDVYTSDAGIFGDLQTANATYYTDLFSDTEPATLDMMLLASYGGRIVSPIIDMYTTYDDDNDVYTISDSGRSAVAAAIWQIYYSQWDKALKALTTDYDPFASSDVTTTVNTTVASDNTQQATSTSDTGTYGFDASTASATDTTSGDNTVTDTGTETTSQTVTKLGKDGGYTYGTLLDNALKAARNSYIGIVLYNVSQYTSINLY